MIMKTGSVDGINEEKYLNTKLEKMFENTFDNKKNKSASTK